MALRDQPYLPLYVQDFLTDEKLIECSASTVGVYIKMMCVMHKSEHYGTILLKQKYKQSDKQNKNFALQIAKSVGFDVACVADAISELLDEKVLCLDGDFLVQNRMVYDADISEKRANAGKKGGDKTKKQNPKSNNFAKAKIQAKSEIEYVYESEDVINEDLKAKKSDLIHALVEHFGFTAPQWSQNRSAIMQFVNSQFLTDEDLNHFVNQFKNYCAYKDASGDKKHSFQSYLGTPAMQFKNSGWNAENWEQKLNNFMSNPANLTKFERTAKAFNGAKNPYDND